MKLARLVPLVPLVLTVPAAAQLRLREFASVDLTSTSMPGARYIGTHPSTIAWTGDLYVAGWNEAGGTSSGIVPIRNVLTAPSYGPVFGSVATPPGFGYTGLDAGNGAIVAAYDHGTTHPEGLQSWSTLIPPYHFWSLDARGSSGAAVSAMPGSAFLGAAWLTIGSDRRALQDLATGATVFSHVDGMVVNPGGNPVWRDIQMTWPDGNLYARRANDVVKVDRTGPNSGIPSVLVDHVDAESVPGQNVDVIDLYPRRFVIYNDRTSTTLGQSFFDVVRVVDDSGAPQLVDWGTFSPPTSNGRYDFSFFQAIENSVAILDCHNRRVTIFHATAIPQTEAACFGDGSGTACPCGNFGATGRGCASSVNPAGANLQSVGTPSLTADTLVLHGTGMPDAPAVYLRGTNFAGNGAGIVFGDGLRCMGADVLRIRLAMNVAGASQMPRLGEPPLSQMNPTVLATYVYQVQYRSAATFCTQSTFNLTNAMVVTWRP